MRFSFYKPLMAVAAAGMIAGCSTTAPKILSTPIEKIDSIPLKVTDLSEDQLKNWSASDLSADTIPGMSVDRAYAEIIKKTKPSTVIVGVVDSGVDIEHPDLKNNIWTNEDEIPGNGKDDDNNGYIDDVHGWNFLGKAVAENLEYVRIIKRLKPKYEGKSESSISTADREEYKQYQEAKAEYEKEYGETMNSLQQYKQIQQQLSAAHNAVSAELGTEDYTKKQLSEYQPQTQQMQQYKAMLTQIQNNVDENIPKALQELQDGIDYFQNRIDTHFNLRARRQSSGWR